MLPCMYCTHVAERDCTKSVDEAYACHYFYLFCFCRTTMWGAFHPGASPPFDFRWQYKLSLLFILSLGKKMPATKYPVE